MPSCMVFGCKSSLKTKMRFFRFPKINRRSQRLTELSTRRQALWLTALRRADAVTCLNSRVCQLHFITGKSANLSDEYNIDWVPTLNMPSEDQDKSESSLENDVAGVNREEMDDGAGYQEEMGDFHGFDEFEESGFGGYHETGLTIDDSNLDDPNESDMCMEYDVDDTEYLDEFVDFEENCAFLNETIDEFYAIDDVENDFYGYENDNLSSEQMENEEFKPKTEHLQIEFLDSRTEDIVFERKSNTVDTKVKYETGQRGQPLLSGLYLNKIHHSVATQTDTSITETPTELFLTYEQKIELLEEKLSSHAVRLENFENNNAKTCFFTGLTNYSTMKSLFHCLEPYLSHNSKLTKFQIFFLVLLRLRLNFSFRYMAYKFEVSPQTISRQFYKGLFVLYSRLRTLVYWPTRNDLQKTMPLAFQEHFGKLITTIIDCFEIYIQKSSLMKAQAQTWSYYKHHNTVKYLIAITPQGMISFISTGYGGRASDKFVTEDCGILDSLQEGDCVMADRGFLVEDVMKDVGVSLNIPAFTKGKTQLHPYELETTRWIANVRIHVERVIGLLRLKYTILNQRKFPISAICKVTNGCNVPVIDQIVTVCSALVNLCRPICVKENIEL